MANSLELAGAGRGGGESDGGQESGQPQGQTHLTAQAHRHGKTARTQGWGLLALLDYHGAHRCSRAGVRPCVLPSVPQVATDLIWGPSHDHTWRCHRSS